MDTKEKLEQAAIVKEKGTMYFKVCKLGDGGGGAGKDPGGDCWIHDLVVDVREAVCSPNSAGESGSCPPSAAFSLPDAP